jgi:hypothetical protein
MNPTLQQLQAQLRNAASATRFGYLQKAALAKAAQGAAK